MSDGRGPRTPVRQRALVQRRYPERQFPGGHARHMRLTRRRLSPAQPGPAQARSANQIPISRAADSGESEPCTRFCWTARPQSRPRSPRMVPGAADRRVGGSRQRAEALDAALPLDHEGGDRPGEHELDERAVERLALVLGVVVGEQLGGGGAQLEGRERVALGLDAAHDLADEATAYAVGLDEDEGTLDVGHAGSLTSLSRAPTARPPRPRPARARSCVRAGRRPPTARRRRGPARTSPG